MDKQERYLKTEDILALTEKCLAASKDYFQALAKKIAAESRNTDKDKKHLLQSRTHTLAWIASYHEFLTSARDYAVRLAAQGSDNDFELNLIAYGFNAGFQHLQNGIPMNQHEFASASNIAEYQIAALVDIEQAKTLNNSMQDIGLKQQLLQTVIERKDWPTMVNTTLSEDVEDMRAIVHRFVQKDVRPFSHRWHIANDYVPLSVLQQMADMGVFGINIPSQYGGMGLGKTEFCAVSTILSRGNIAVGSLGTRSDIAAELISHGGTAEQKEYYLPKIASGEMYPTVAFTEPDTGSDLANITTRASKKDGKYYISGNKTWITHAARATLMIVMARTGTLEQRHRGLSMFVIEKPAENENDFFPIEGIKGGEIEVIGYRGMKEFDMAFDNFEVAQGALLGDQEGQGFKQLMRTFESARIQTAARSTGVAHNALDLAIQYACERKQFGKKIIEFPRIADKILYISAEIALLNNFICQVAQQKDTGIRCDQQAGMVKLIAARAAWAAADNALQIHGGNGFAIEYEISRILCDARVLNIFEGAAEIQAEVISRRVIDGIEQEEKQQDKETRK